MVEKEAIRMGVGVVGNIISFFLFASPVQTFYKIWKKKDVEGYKPDPYLASVMNCVLWIFYGQPFVHPHSVLVVTINGIGLTLELVYLIVYVLYAPSKKRMKVFVALVIEAVFFVAIAAITLKVFHTHTKRSMVVGILCVFFVVCMYMSPLTIMGKVIKTKSVEYMPFLLSLANFLNGVVWVIYALLRFDPYILVGNGLGALGGLAQLILYGVYYKSTPPKDEGPQKFEPPQSTGVQLSNSRSRSEVSAV